jgi:hypothetical protein
MLGDISSPEAVERERRSVAMLSSGVPVYDREEALTILEALAAALAATEASATRTRRRP